MGKPCARKPIRRGAKPKRGSRRCARRSPELLDDEAVRVAVVDALPEAAPVDSIERILQGWGSESWVADTALGRLVVKVGLPGSDREKWRASASGLELARRAGVPSPELLAFVDAVPTLDDRIMRLFRYIEGSTPRAEASAVLANELGATVRRLHAIEMPRFTSRVGGDGFDDFSAFLAHRWVATLGRVQQAGIDARLVRRAKADADVLAAEVNDVVAPALCHRDLYLDNLLVDEVGALVALLDFDLVEVWDPLVE